MLILCTNNPKTQRQNVQTAMQFNSWLVDYLELKEEGFAPRHDEGNAKDEQCQNVLYLISIYRLQVFPVLDGQGKK